MISVQESKQPNTFLKRQGMFKTANEFSLHIEKRAAEDNIPCMDAVLAYCEENQLEPEDVSKLISQSLKDKIEMEFRDLNYLPKQATLDV